MKGKEMRGGRILVYLLYEATKAKTDKKEDK
jgi:hypothetical protein